MKIKSYDDIILVECDKKKHYYLFDTLEGGKWIDIDGKSQFAISRSFEEQLTKIVNNFNNQNPKLDKYNKDVSLIAKEEYFKSFDSTKPVDFSRINTKKSISSLSSSTYDESSSDGFPSPRTPGKHDTEEEDDEEEEEGNEEFEFIIEKLEELEKRIERLESSSRKR